MDGSEDRGHSPSVQAAAPSRWARDPFSGYSHLVGAGLALVGGLWLTLVGWGGEHPFAVATYAGCLTALYAASSAYHLCTTIAEIKGGWLGD